MKRLILTAGLMFALLAPASAFASYVCDATYFPGVSRVRATLTSEPNCIGTTTTLWFCEATSTSSSCASSSAARYQVPELINLHSQLARAADTQQSVTQGTTTCFGGTTTGCGYYIIFRS
jgi:hypothetical protein